MSFIFQLVGLPFTVIGGSISLAHEGVGLAVQTVKDRRQRRKISSQLRYAPTEAARPTRSSHCKKHCDCERSRTAQEVANDLPPPYTEAVEQLPTKAVALPLADRTASPSSRRLQKPRSSEERRVSSEKGGFDAQGSLLHTP